MTELFAVGFFAGLALAIPVGPMAIMLIGVTMQKGWRHGSVGALGMSLVDFSYAVTVFLVGQLILSFLGEWSLALIIAGGLILLILGVNTLIQNLKLLSVSETEPKFDKTGVTLGGTLAIFMGATLFNPPTALYFVALIPSVAPLAQGTGINSALAFSLGVFLGSGIWQQTLALAGLGLRKVTTNKVRALIGSIGGVLIIALAVGLIIRGVTS